MGRGVGDQNAPVSSSRMKIASAAGSLTASLDHAVKRLAWLFTDQVKPDPVSVTWKPKSPLLATMLDHGAGVHCPSPSAVTYSRPPWANPPNPLKKASFGGVSTGSG